MNSINQLVTQEAIKALQVAVHATLDAIAAAGSDGAKSTVFYMAMMAHGATLNQFTTLMNSLMKIGDVSFQNERYFITEKGKITTKKLASSLNTNSLSDVAEEGRT